MQESIKINPECPEWITYEEAQRLTSLGRTTLWRICSTEDSEIEVAHVGRAVRINRAGLMAYMKRSAGGDERELNDVSS
jgi:excisionase family DNA binding protein